MTSLPTPPQARRRRPTRRVRRRRSPASDRCPPRLPARSAHPSEPLRPTGRSSDQWRAGHPVPIDPVAARQAPRDLRRPWRVVIAVLLPLGPLFVAVAFALRPFTGSEEPAVIIAQILASPRTDLLLWLGFLAPGLLLLGTVTAGHLARRGAPVLATIATTINALAFGLMSGAVASGDLITVAGGRAGVDPATILTITDAIENSPITGRAGHLGARPHPRHGPAGRRPAPSCRGGRPSCSAISQPIHFLAFVVLDDRYVDALAGWASPRSGSPPSPSHCCGPGTTTGTCPRHLGSSHISVALTDPPPRALPTIVSGKPPSCHVAA